jgi:hypothetical protein
MPGRAVEYGGVFDTTPPDGSTAANWDAGWGSAGVTGWDYVGQIGGASGVYLGNGWVLTAGHVGGGNFTLGGVTYNLVTNSAVTLTNTSVDTAIDPTLAGTTADLTLFQISTSPDLPALTLSSTDPSTPSHSSSGSTVVMIGYGGGQGETWGENTITQKNLTINPDGTSFQSLDFATEFGANTICGQTITNTAQLVSGDSGGGDFIYNSSTGLWELAGINEAIDTDTYTSYMVQLSDYDAQIDSIMAESVPEPDTYLILGLGLGMIGVLSRRRSKAS